MLAGRLKMGDSSNADARLRGDAEAAMRHSRSHGGGVKGADRLASGSIQNVAPIFVITKA
jgi:hypothetical protein